MGTACARLAMGRLLSRKSWLELRSELWHGAPASNCAVGFRFDESSDWSKPEEALDQGLQDRRQSIEGDKTALGAEPDHTIRWQFWA